MTSIDSALYLIYYIPFLRVTFKYCVSALPFSISEVFCNNWSTFYDYTVYCLLFRYQPFSSFTY